MFNRDTRIEYGPITSLAATHNAEYPNKVYGIRVGRNKNLVMFSEEFHVGNPFYTDKVANTMNKTLPFDLYEPHGTIREVSERYIKWLRGEVNHNTEPMRRAWINSMIELGAFDNSIFLYYRRPALNDDENTNHILELIDYMYERRGLHMWKA